MSSITTHKYHVLDINLNVAETGSGPALVFIHGWSNNWQGWTLLAQILSSRYHLYMIDLPGFGDSDPLDRYSLTQAAAYLNAFITTNNIKPQAIVAASLGTLVTAKTLSLYPGLTDKLILIGAVFSQLNLKHASKLFLRILELSNKTFPTQEVLGYTIKSRYTAYLVEKYLNAYKFDRHKVDQYSLPGRQKMSGKSYIQMGLSAAKFSLEDYLGKTTKPTLLIYGNADKYTTPQQAKTILERIGNNQIEINVIPKCGHI